MGIRITRRRLVWAFFALIVGGVLAGAITFRVLKQAEERARSEAAKAAVTLEFGASDLVFVEAKALSRWLPVSGTLQPLRQAIVKSKVPGEVRQITVREGETVRPGQVLVRLDTADLDARVAERLGALESARAQLALAEKTRAMNVKLLNEKFISQNAFDNSESSQHVWQGNVKSAEAQLQLARNALKDAEVVAPLAGIVAKRHVQPGEKVQLDAPLVTVVDLREMELQALVPAVDVPEIRIGMPVELVVDGFGERRFTGRVQRINPSTEPNTRAILVYVELPNPDAALRSGMFANGRIALAAGAPTPTLPATAVRVEAGQTYVWTIERGKLARRVVSVGRRDDEAGRIELKTVLLPNVPVLATRFDNLREGAPAIVRVPAPTSDPAAVRAPVTG